MNLIVSMKLEFNILKRNSKRPKLPNHSKSPPTFPDHYKNIEPKTRETHAKGKKNNNNNKINKKSPRKKDLKKKKINIKKEDW